PIQSGVWTEHGIVGPEEGPDENAAAEPAGSTPAGNMDGEKAGQERDDNAIGMKLVWCPPGKFTMGGFKGEGAPPGWKASVEVSLSSGFWLGKYEVTQSQWTQLGTPLLWKGQANVREGDDFPATYLSWENAMAFCAKLTARERAAG